MPTDRRWFSRVPALAALVALAGALLLPPAGETQSTLGAIKKRDKMIVGVKTDFPPFGSVDASGKNIGFDIDVAY